MITGSDNGTKHVIEEVVFDFSFDSGTITHESESLMSTWVVDELLPTVETALNEYDENDNILRIEQITIDLGDIPSSGADFSTRIISRLYEQLVIQLNEARSLGASITQSSRQLMEPANRQHMKSLTDGLTVQQVNRLQSDLEILEHFLTTGNMPWHVDATDSSVHEKLLKGVLFDENGANALCALFIKIASTKRSLFVRRLVSQFSNKNLEKILIHVAAEQHELLLDLVRAYQSVISKQPLSAKQQTGAMQALWEQVFNAIIRDMPILDSSNLFIVFPQILQKLAAAVLLDQNTLMNQLIHASSSHSKDTRLSMILTDQIRKVESGKNFTAHSKDNKTASDKKTINEGDSLYARTASENKSLSHEALLCQHIKAALQQTEIDEKARYLERLQSSSPRIIQKQLFKILQDKAGRTQLAARLPKFILIDITYLLSAQAAMIIEQLLLHAETLYQQTINRSHITIAAWEQQLWENTFSFLAETPLNRSFEATRFVRALAQTQPDDQETVTALKNWHEVLVNVQRQEHGALQNILFNAISSSEAEQQAILTSQEMRLITNVLATDFKRGQQRLKTALETGRLVPEKLSGTEVRRVVEAFLKHAPSYTDTNDQTFIEAIVSHARKAPNRASYYQHILEKLLSGQIIDLEAIVARISDEDSPIQTKAETIQRSAGQPAQTGADIYQRIASALQQSGIPGTGPQLGRVRTDDAQIIKTHLLEMFQDNGVRAQLIARLPESVLIDIAYIQSPQAALVLEQILVHAERLNRRAANHRHLDSKAWKKHLLENALNFLVTQPDVDLSTHSFDASHFLHEIAKGLSDGEENRPVLYSWLEALQQQDHKAGIATSALQNSILDALANASSVHQDVLTIQEAKLISDETIDLKDVTNEKQSIQNKQTDAAIYQRILSALKRVAKTESELQFGHLHTADIPSIKNQLLKHLQDTAWRTQLITQLPQPVLLDISYMLSPQAAIILEQLMQHAETLRRKTVNSDLADTAEWEQQVWENALSFFVHKSLDRSIDGLFDAINFLHRLVHDLSDRHDTAAILKSWRDVLKQEQRQEKTVLHNILVDAISSSKAAPRDILTSEEIGQITAGLKTDYKREQQRLKTAFHSGRFILEKLSGNELKSVIQALLTHDPALTGDDSQTFLNAIETYADKTANTPAYYQHILEKLLRGQPVDLEYIVSQSIDVDDWVLADTGKEQPVVRPTAAVTVIYQRIRSVLEQSGIAGTALFLEQSLTATNIQTIRKHLLDLLQQTAIRVQLIARLSRPYLFDIIYLLSPQAALVIEQLLLNAEMLFQYTPKKHAATIAEWEQQLWDNSLNYLLAMPTIDASADRLNTLAFIQTLINKLSESNDEFTVIQSWRNALTQMRGIEYGQDHGTRVLRHSIEALLAQQKSVSQQRPDQSFHPQPLTTGTDDHAELMMPDQMAEIANDDIAGEEFYIHNAGQVLAAPYLPRLFSLLGLIGQGAFIDRSTAERAVLLLQFMVNEETQSPEYQLLLNKIMCGLSTGIPVCNRIDVSQREQETVENLIQGMIQNWKNIGNTSIQGLRETFLQRTGRLLLKDDMWFLTIEPGPFDMLLDQLPWSFSVIKHSWMERAIHVTWR